MSDTKQLGPLPPRTLPASQPIGWWRKIRGNVLAVSILIHVLLAIVAGWFVMQHFKTPVKAQPIPIPPSPPGPIVHPQTPSSAPAPINRIKTKTLSNVNFPETPISSDAPVPPQQNAMAGLTPWAGPGAGSIGGPLGVTGPTLPYGGLNVRDGLTGRLYDLKQDRSHRATGLHMDGYADTIRKYVANGWTDSDLARFYVSPTALGTYQFFIPNIDAEQGPAAFKAQKNVQPTMWLAHYKGTVVAPESGRYHFVGAGDDVMLVGFGGQLVLDRCWNFKIKDSTANYEYGYTGIPGGFARGDAVDVVKGQSYPIDILIGEQPGGKMFAFLFLEKEGETYQKDPRGNPILPVFRVKDVALPKFAPETKLPPYDSAAPAWSVWRTVPPVR